MRPLCDILANGFTKRVLGRSEFMFRRLVTNIDTTSLMIRLEWSNILNIVPGYYQTIDDNWEPRITQGSNICETRH